MDRTLARRGAAMTALLLTAGLLTGCGAKTDGPAIRRAEHFYRAIADRDATTACRDLAPRARQSLEQQEKKKCEDAILNQDLPTTSSGGHVRVYGSMAEVRHHGEAAFLSRYDNRWLITAVGCSAVGHDQPYDCTIEVG